jgi:hypothetical protein
VGHCATALQRTTPDARKARPAFAVASAEESARLCEAQCLCELHVALELSVLNDNCKREFAEVYSTSLRKGIPVERRRRKASGPMARGRRIAGLPAKASARSGRHTSIISPRFHSSAGLFAMALRPACICVSGAKTKNEEQRKLNWANPSKGGDAKPPVYRTRVLRQRGCHMSHGVIRDDHTCAPRRAARPHSRAGIGSRIAHASPSGEACVTAQPLLAPSPQNVLRLDGAQTRCEP